MIGSILVLIQGKIVGFFQNILFCFMMNFFSKHYEILINKYQNVQSAEKVERANDEV